MTDTVVLFAGHRVDAPDRDEPRFPADCESKARQAIRSALQRIIDETQSDSILGIAGAADGGDILFHELCAELGIVSEVCLALPPENYVRTSVQPAWSHRFHRLLEHQKPALLAPGPGDIWQRDHEWQLARAELRQPRRIILLALVDADDPGPDEPGGTAAMVRMARESGVEVIQLDTRQICH
jgi:hypothetical protein